MIKDVNDRFSEVYNYLKSSGKVSGKGDLAHKLHVSPSLITEITKKRTNPGLPIIQNIVDEFKEISAQWLLTGNGQMIMKNEHYPPVHHGPLMLNDEENKYYPSGKLANSGATASPTRTESASPAASPTTENELIEALREVISKQDITIDVLRESLSIMRRRIDELESRQNAP